MNTVDNISIFSFPFICDLAEFYGITLMLLAALMSRKGCGGMRAAVLPASISFRNMD
jgi:hypothetical protein